MAWILCSLNHVELLLACSLNGLEDVFNCRPALQTRPGLAPKLAPMVYWVDGVSSSPFPTLFLNTTFVNLRFEWHIAHSHSQEMCPKQRPVEVVHHCAPSNSRRLTWDLTYKTVYIPDVPQLAGCLHQSLSLDSILQLQPPAPLLRRLDRSTTLQLAALVPQAHDVRNVAGDGHWRDGLR